MGAPTITQRQVPTGYKLEEGFVFHYTFASAPGVSIWETEGKLFSFDGGEAIKTTTQFNNRMRTQVPPHLIELGPLEFTGFCDPDVIPILFNLINRLDSLTVLFPTGDQFAFWAWLRKAETDTWGAGKPAMLNLTIEASNEDTGHVEQQPVYQAAAGT
jgi:hypothetical protein